MNQWSDLSRIEQKLKERDERVRKATYNEIAGMLYEAAAKAQQMEGYIPEVGQAFVRVANALKECAE